MNRFCFESSVRVSQSWRYFPLYANMNIVYVGQCQIM